MPDETLTDTDTETDTATDEANIPLTIDDAVVAIGGAGNDDDEHGLPDEIHLSLSHAVTADTVDGFDLEGTLAEIDGVRVGTGDDSDDDDEAPPGDRTLVLELTLTVTPDEEPTVSYDPERGDVQTATGFEPVPVEELPVSRGPPPRPIRAFVPVGSPDVVRVEFDGLVDSRTGDATAFELAGGDEDGSELAGGIEVGSGDEDDGDSEDDETDAGDDSNSPDDIVSLPLASDLDREVAVNEELFLEYDVGGGDDEQTRRNLVSPDGAIVGQFSEAIERDVDADEIEFTDVTIPADDRDRLHVRFDPPMTAESAAGFELEGTLARIEGLTEDVETNGVESHAEFDLHIPVVGEETPVLTYDPGVGDVRTADGTEPAESLETDVETAGPVPTAQRASVVEDGENDAEAAVAIEFSAPVVSRTTDATGFQLSGVGDEGPALTGEIDAGETIELPLSQSIGGTDETPAIKYVSDDDDSTVNLVSDADGVVVDAFDLEIEDDDEPTVEFARIPDDRRDVVEVRFTTAIDAASAAGFELNGSYARVDGLAEADVDDDLEPSTLALSLHVEATDEVLDPRLAYDEARGTVESESGVALSSFEDETVEAIPGAPVLERATVGANAREVRVQFSRDVALHAGDATGFSLEAESETDGGPVLTGDARADGSDVVLPTTDDVSTETPPTVSYEPDDANVLGEKHGVLAEAGTATVETDP